MLKILIFILFPQICMSSSWITNKDHSELFFQVPYLSISEVTGRFTTFIGEMDLSEKDEIKSLGLRVTLNSIETGNQIRDGHLKKSDFFNIKEFPEASFVSQSIKKLGPGAFEAEGNLEIKKITQKMKIKFTLSEAVADTWKLKSRFLKFNFSLRRSDFKLNWNKTLQGEKLLVGDDVKIWGTFQLQLPDGKTPPSKHLIPDTEYIRDREELLRGEKTQGDLDKKFGGSALPSANPLSHPPTEQYPSPLPLKVSQSEKSTLWWLCLCILGLLGFMSIIWISYELKYNFSKRFPKLYKETSSLGYVSDFLVIILVTIYSLALWYVGWGVEKSKGRTN